jgi:hypothetical protein
MHSPTLSLCAEDSGFAKPVGLLFERDQGDTAPKCIIHRAQDLVWHARDATAQRRGVNAMIQGLLSVAS